MFCWQKWVLKNIMLKNIKCLHYRNSSIIIFIIIIATLKLIMDFILAKHWRLLQEAVYC